jgi:tRNA threonylcarbamoyladenosine biosynthesis protein TsaE
LTPTAFSSVSLDQLSSISNQAIALAKNRSLWCFYGEMGAGKTTFIKEICASLGILTPITSPTFSLVNEYQTPSGKPIYHFDFYRINSIEEVYDIGYEDYFYSGHICLIEWPEKIESLLAGELLFKITLTKTNETDREIVFN